MVLDKNLFYKRKGGVVLPYSFIEIENRIH